MNRKDISYKTFCEYFYLDKTSPSGLRWKVDRTNGKNFILVKSGDIAGTSIKNNYRIVTLDRKSYFIHKIIWVLFNKQDCQSSYVVDHIDGNTLNNNPENLKKCTVRDNTCNKKKSQRNKSNKTGVYLKNMKGHLFWTATWQDLDGKKVRKYFSLNKYGNQKAYELACEVRDLAIRQLMQKGINYTERHVNG